MIILNKHMRMNNPNELSFWQNVAEVGKVITPWLSGAWVFHQAINKVFKYFSDSRDAELRNIVDKAVQPKLDDMSLKIEALSKNIWSLEQLLKK